MPDGTLDLTFNANFDSTPSNIAVQADGKILVSQSVVSANDEASTIVMRLMPNGMLDTEFATITVNESVSDIIVQPNGDIILGGSFTMINETTSRTSIARFDTSGNLDDDFNPSITNEGNVSVGTIVLQVVNGIERILIAGSFTTVDSSTYTNIARLDINGDVDTTFVATDLGGDIFDVALDSNNRILIGGPFAAIANAGVARLDSNGSLDSEFNAAPITIGPTSAPAILTIAVQADNKVVVGGVFTNVGGEIHNGVARLQENGDLDTGFSLPDPGVNLRIIRELIVQANQQILVGGAFLDVGGIPMTADLVRLNPNSSINQNFAVNISDGSIFSMALQASDGSVLISGDFQTINGEDRPNIARLANTIPRPEIGFSNTTQSQQEGNTDDDPTIFTFQVTNVLPEGALDVASSVSYAVSGSGANPANAQDFVGGEFPTGTLNFANSNSNDTITIEIARDADIEENETFTVTLSNQNPNTTTLTTATAQGTILDDDEEDDILCLPIPANNGNFAVICL